MFSSQDKLFMERAIELAKESFDDGEVPVGAVIVQNEMIIGEGKNKVIFEMPPRVFSNAHPRRPVAVLEFKVYPGPESH